ncbi:1-phosphofructokinase family hexose kinase [Roseibium sp.]|uniref:1-phosphofructokinase family hexose kinase n=1 Tax=Roseibium sp. TaxID=1936156 RepID=UPI003BB0E23D
MSGILCIALNPTIDVSCDAERVKSMHKTRTSNQRQDPGGGGVNVARVVAELGGKPEIAYFSGGETGVLLDEFLKRTQIDLHAFPMQHPVRLAFAVHEESSGVEYRFVPEGPEVSAEELAPLLSYVAQTDADYVVASGSLPRGAPDSTYADMMDALEGKGVRFVVDTSGMALKAALDRGGVFLVKPSIGELETLSGRSLDEQGAREFASDLVERGAAENVAVTLGTKGALLVSAKRILRVPALHVAAKSAVGAGDSFVGAMIWALSAGREIDEAFRLGVAAGAAAALTSGTELCRRADVLSLYESDLAERRHSLREH